MPIAVGGRGFDRFQDCDSPAIAGRKRSSAAAAVSRSSSIGWNSDCSGRGSETDNEGSPEVQSRLKGPLETMDAIRASLPVRRGFSRFYDGKSKSFTSLANVVVKASSASDLAKPENPFTRKRKNLLAFGGSSPARHNTLTALASSTPKRLPASGRNVAAAAFASACSSSSGSNSSEEESEPSWLRCAPPTPPASFPLEKCHSLGEVSVGDGDAAEGETDHSALRWPRR